MRRRERYWYFSMGVFFISRIARPLYNVSPNYARSIIQHQLTSLGLCLEAVNTRRGETVCPQVLPGLGLVCGVIVASTIEVRKSCITSLERLNRSNCLRRGVNMSGRRVVVSVLDVGGGKVTGGVDGRVCVRSHGALIQTT